MGEEGVYGVAAERQVQRGVCLLAAGNAPLITREGVVNRPVRGVSPSRLALAWRAADHRPLVRGYVHAAGRVPAQGDQ